MSPLLGSLSCRVAFPILRVVPIIFLSGCHDIPGRSFSQSMYHITSQLFIDISASIIKEMYPAGIYSLCAKNYPRYGIRIRFSKHV